ncbi:MAG: ComEA family DNA-binding protein [Chloroflexi bacterium]|nr:ComEA family DNA-binding protein [Chloroflexota bacterium]
MADNKWGWLAVGLFLGIMVGVGGLTLLNRVQPAPIIIEPPPPTAAPEPTGTPGPMRVYVNGQVAAPDVYELPPGSIVETAVTAAGGFTEEANTAVVNLAQPLQDGVQVYVPAQDEQVSAPANVVSEPASSADDGETAVSKPSGALVNINQATKDELDTLPGVGPSTAQKIIEHRDANGNFTTIEAIMDVSGIGEAKFNQMKELITVDE